MHSVAMQDPTRLADLLGDDSPRERDDFDPDAQLIDRLAAMTVSVANGCVVTAHAHLAELADLDQREAQLHRRVQAALYEEWASPRERQQVDHGQEVS